MRESLRRLLVVFAACWLLAAHAAIDVVDDRGTHLHFGAPPQRIVSLLPSLTEAVCALHACDRLVGVDDYSDWPARVRALPHVGGLEDARVETIVALHPDLVIAHPASRALERLRSLGVPVLALEPRTLEDVRRVLDVLAPVLGTSDAPAVWRRIEQGMDEAARKMPTALRGTRVYVEVNGAPYAASAGSFVGELLARLGVVDVVPARLGPFPKINPEFVVRADPQIIIAGRGDAQRMRTRPGWDRISALRTGRVCALPPGANDIVMRPGPRLGEAAAVLVDCLQHAGHTAGSAR
jgi:iron complex transport system substrate-binding protein